MARHRFNPADGYENVDFPNGGISWYLYKTFVKGFWNAIFRMFPIIGDVAFYVIDYWTAELKSEADETTTRFIDYLLQTQGLPAGITTFLQSIRNRNTTFAIAANYFISVFTTALGIFAIHSPLYRHALQEANRVTQNEIPDAMSIMEMLNRGMIDTNRFHDLLAQLGYDGTIRNGFFKIRHDQMTPTELIVLLNRGIIDNGKFIQLLRERGYEDESIQYYALLAEYVPGPSDLIRFSVRDIYDSGIVNKYGYDNEFPVEFANDARKQGIPVETARKYWRAHWNVPSPTQAYEMLHRGIIGESEVDDILKIADYPAYWREKLTQLSYRPLTRVDIRRMYQDGVLSTDELQKAYLDVGYNPFNASKMVQWTINEFAIRTSELTKKQILKSYRNGIFNKTEVEDLLIKFGLSQFDISVLLRNEDITIQDKFESQMIKEIKAGFMTNTLDVGEVRNQLSLLEMSTVMIDNNLMLWDLEKKRRTKKPSIRDLKGLYAENHLTAEQVRKALVDSNYSPEYVSAFLSQITEV